MKRLIAISIVLFCTSIVTAFAAPPTVRAYCSAQPISGFLMPQRVIMVGEGLNVIVRFECSGQVLDYYWQETLPSGNVYGFPSSGGYTYFHEAGLWKYTVNVLTRDTQTGKEVWVKASAFIRVFQGAI